MVNDKEITSVMRQNAEKGFRLLMASYKEPVYWHIRRLVVSHADAQDAAQETFVRVFRNFQQYNEANSFKAWIFRIATNEATTEDSFTNVELAYNNLSTEDHEYLMEVYEEDVFMIEEEMNY